ncbi:type IV fimbrial biogenesis protein FimT [Desulfuromusa kysingii]|uniref:Type II secretion system protein H n=1 Tax=Desulfuromusa kysingii TaxID=37625 RepID=A0A1H4E999_9BACT|nr:GspH/FimT family pseudopilin [Desulfuromusa kysingii]SEA81644.1 type IV fimbrial biogenesis protein FimT [Desulfuromusa kysingii]
MKKPMRMKCCRRKYNSSGFTLIEVIVVMIVVGILATIAIPSYIALNRSSRVTSAVNELVSTCNYARSEAVTRSEPVTICKSNALNTACVTNGTGWQQGWIVFVDLNADGAITAGNDTILRVQAAIGGVTMDGGGTVDDFLTYARTGFLDLNDDDVADRTIEVTSDSNQMDIVFAKTGRVRTERN